MSSKAMCVYWACCYQKNTDDLGWREHTHTVPLLLKLQLLFAECLHGGVDTGETRYGMTSFPQPLALAATFDRDLLHDIAVVISEEMRAVSNLYREADGTARHVTILTQIRPCPPAISRHSFELQCSRVGRLDFGCDSQMCTLRDVH